MKWGKKILNLAPFMATLDTKFPLSFARCNACQRIGAEVELPSNRHACNNICAAIVANGGKGAVPPTVSAERGVADQLCQSNGLRPQDIGAAVVWLALAPADVAARVAGLHSMVEDYRKENPGPYSKSPLPMDPTLFNIMLRYAAAYSRACLDKEIVETAVPSREEEQARLASLAQKNNPHTESDTAAHAETLFLLYVLLFRPWLAWWDYSILASDTSVIPKAPVDKNNNLLVRRDTEEALAVLRVLMQRSVHYLYHNVGLSKSAIRAFLIDGLLAPAAGFEEEVASAPNESSTQEVVNVNVSQALIGINMADASKATRDLISTVETVNDGVFDWIRSRARKTVSRVRGIGSSRRYNPLEIASSLYKVYLANVCDGEIARGTGIAVPGMANLAAGSGELAAGQVFSLSYVGAYTALPSSGNNAAWKSAFDGMVNAASRFVSSRDSRLDRITSYTCNESASGRIQTNEYRRLPALIAAQVQAMGAYYYSVDPKKPKSGEEHRINVQKDVEQLLIELRRKVGSEAAATLLALISPVIIRS